MRSGRPGAVLCLVCLAHPVAAAWALTASVNEVICMGDALAGAVGERYDVRRKERAHADQGAPPRRVDLCHLRVPRTVSL